MNSIMKKCAPKRKYVRKPMCENLTGICTFNKCRCSYPLVEPQTKAKIDEYLHHREKVIKRRREIELMKLDFETEFEETMKNWNSKSDYQGEFAKRKELRAKYRKMIWLVLKIFIAIPILYILFINIFQI